MQKILTISVAAYNAEKDIANCLNSMIHTDVANQLEIIVVNDGSKDHTAQVVEEYVEKYPNIVKLINKQNGGHGSTINASIREATGKYYKIVDSDDWVDREGIEQLVKKLQTTDVDLVLNPYYNINASTRTVSDMVKPYSDVTERNVVRNIEQISIANGKPEILLFMHAITFKTSVVKKMGAVISEKCFYVDMEYTIFPLLCVKDYVCLDFPVYHYLLGTATQSMNISNLIKRRDQHLRVTKRIIAFYKDHKNEMTESIKKIVLFRVNLAVYSQYVIYFSMKPDESRKEVVDFDRWLKVTDSEVYAVNIGSKFIKVLKLIRATKFVIYNPVVHFLNFIGVVPKL